VTVCLATFSRAIGGTCTEYWRRAFPDLRRTVNITLSEFRRTANLLFLLFQKAQARPINSIQLELDGLLNDCRQAVARIQILHSHLLAAGDTSWWDTPGVDNGRAGAPFVAAVKIESKDGGSVGDAVESLSKAIRQRAADALGAAALYQVTQRYVMVHEGEPTEIGLRGLDALRTIGEARADNQRAPELLRSLYRYP
jgi:hypothetical protein